MARDFLRYRAELFRGWEVVRLEYVLEEREVVMRRARTWRGAQDQRVELESLSGEVRRVWGRQPAFVISTVVLVLALLVLGLDATIHGFGAAGRSVDWRLWGPVLAVATAAWVVRVKTRRPAEWAHFVGKGKGTGLYVLKDGRDGAGFERFVGALKKRVGS